MATDLARNATEKMQGKTLWNGSSKKAISKLKKKCPGPQHLKEWTARISQ